MSCGGQEARYARDVQSFPEKMRGEDREGGGKGAAREGDGREGRGISA
jgi:hypothetical protein